MRWERFEGDWRSGFDGLQGGVRNSSLSFRLWGVLERGGELLKISRVHGFLVGNYSQSQSPTAILIEIFMGWSWWESFPAVVRLGREEVNYGLIR